MHRHMTLRLLFAVPLCVIPAIATAQQSSPGWRANPDQVTRQEKARAGINYTESKVGSYVLPDPLVTADGTKITTKEHWEQRGRAETLDLFRKHVYGRTPDIKDVKFEVVKSEPDALDGKAIRRQIRITAKQADKSFAFNAWLLVPNDRKGKVPAFLLINNRPVSSADPSRQQKDGFWPAEEILARGYATAVFRTVDVDPDKNGPEARAQGVRGAFTSPGDPDKDGWATLSAWAWGSSRVLDYLATDPDIDATKVAVIGHSRGGKTALWAGAQDTRFALAISSCSGAGGAALSRRIYGETVAVINKAFPYWFAGNFKQFDDKESELPIDQHQLIALMAPRAVAVGSADEDLWADPLGEFLGLAHASPVFALYGLPTLSPSEVPPLDTPINRGKLHYHVRRGNHNLTPYDWKCYMDFADTVWGSTQ